MANFTDAGFTEGNLMRHVTMMSLTASIGLMAVFAVDLVDIYFISLLGQKALAAAAGYASMLLFFASAINIGLSIAAATLVSRALGARKPQDAQEFASSVAVIALIVGMVVPLLALPNLDFLLKLLGASEDLAEMAKGYLWIILPATFLSGIGMVGVAVLRAHGDGRGAMLPALLGGLVNGVADPIFIFAFDLGLHGAAVATVLARCVTMATAIWLAQRRYQAFGWPRSDHLRRDFSSALGLATPAVLTTLATPIGSAIVTREMTHYGVDAVAGLAVINRLVPVAFAVVLALSGAIGPIIGQNFGAENPTRVKEAFWDAIGFVAVYVLFVSGVLYLLRAEVAMAFDATGLSQQLIFLFCGPLALASFFNGVIFVANAGFNNLGHPGYSTWLNWGRHTLGTWPFAIYGGQVWGASGVLIGQAFGGAIFAAIAVLLATRVMDNGRHDREAGGFCKGQYRLTVLHGRTHR